MASRTCEIIYNQSALAFGTEISIDYNYVPEKELVLGLVHPNFLFCFAVDSLNKTLIHCKYDMTLADYIKRETTTRHYWIPYLKNNVLRHKIKVKYMSENIQPILRGIMSFIIYIHSLGLSMNGFEIENLVLKEKIIKFWRVKLFILTDDNRKSDFVSMLFILDKNFLGRGNPPEVDDLYSLIFDDIIDSGRLRVNDEESLLDHLALLTTKEKLCFIKNCSERKNLCRYENRFSKVMYEAAVQEFSDGPPFQNFKGWKKHFSDYKLGPLYDCFWFRNSYKDGSVWDKNSEARFLRNKSMLLCARNLASHLKDFMPKYGWIPDEGVYAMISHVLGKELLRFQKLLARYKILHMFV